VGVAGIHRLLSQKQLLYQASVLIVAAGMEGALPSVVAGLVDKPVIAVPTSVGYGASFGGITALLGMLNSAGNAEQLCTRHGRCQYRQRLWCRLYGCHHKPYVILIDLRHISPSSFCNCELTLLASKV
jgi:hypothetical protein